MNLPKLSVTRRVTVTMLILILALFGWISLSNFGLGQFQMEDEP